MTNPLLEPWDTPFDMPPFDRIEDGHFMKAVETALVQAREAVEAIASNPETPSFTNTIEALETADETLGRVLGVFYNIAGADTNDERQELSREFSPMLSAYSSDVAMNTALFARIEALWQSRDTLDLTGEQQRLLYLTRRRFVRAGAELEGIAKDRLRSVTERLSSLGVQFTQNLLADERDWMMELTEDELEGLPDFVIDAARAAGAERGVKGPVITLSRSIIVPFLQFSPRRDLRERAHAAWTARGANGGETDNRAIAAEILELREERAGLLGYDDFAEFKLETEMAKTPEAVRELLMKVWEPARDRAVEDGLRLSAMMHNDGVNGDLEPWDWRYYSEKRRMAEHDLDESEIKPYLQLDRMIEAAFDCANRLFGLDFAPVDVPLYHPDVRAWEVTRKGEHIAIFLGDYFARGSKRSGAWCSAIRSQKAGVRPIVVNVCNFAKPSKGKPALLSYDDARTLFHEFGHALHQMLSNVTYESISGTSVARDFVELPSQLFEHWLEVPEVLTKYATHADTGAPMPDEMRDRLLAASTYDMGFHTVEYLGSAIVDLEFHTGEAPEDPIARQQEILDGIEMPKAIGMRHATPHFAHIFSGDGYSSGYYSYMWSEVMDADAFAAFQEAGGPFDPDMAEKLERHILSAGGSQEAADAYIAFRGRMPGPEALLKGRGLDAV
ncbi:M3 family metallopeptidase [Palleronia sp.]|uniref:M3 family metallopeptidase n=1 Tax=Palleronia sp. TaxID=1940284 RepID=UPI0035C78EE0